MEALKIIVALATFSYIALTTNKNILDQRDVLIVTEAQIFALGYAQQLGEEISTKSFDEKTTDNKTVKKTDDLTSAANFGLDGGEGSKDDVDDYHGATYNFDSQRIEGFEAKVKVKYLDDNGSWVSNSYKSFIKQIEIVIKNNNFMTDSIVVINWATYHNKITLEKVYCRPY